MINLIPDMFTTSQKPLAILYLQHTMNQMGKLQKVEHLEPKVNTKQQKYYMRI